MIIKNLVVENFGCFLEDMSLISRREKYEQQAPIVLFGGLNGAGKTSILTAILVALYGRQAIGFWYNSEVVREILRESIHKIPDALIENNMANVELTFSFGNMGAVREYRVKRSWTVDGARIEESLKIFDNDSLLGDLSKDQGQAFLSELIPIGISDLFFFDGEKIKELAEDKTGKALSDAIKKLLGLDLINRLSADLTLLLRDKEKEGADSGVLKDLKIKEEELEKTKLKASELLGAFEQTKYQLVEKDKELDRINAELDASGAAWAKDRESLLREHAVLSATGRIWSQRSNLIWAATYH